MLSIDGVCDYDIVRTSRNDSKHNSTIVYTALSLEQNTFQNNGGRSWDWLPARGTREVQDTLVTGEKHGKESPN